MDNKMLSEALISMLGGRKADSRCYRIFEKIGH